MRNASVVIGFAGLLVATVAISTPPPPKPDLRCAELTADRLSTMEVPLRVKVHLKVKNFGPGNSDGFVSRLSYRKGSGSWIVYKDYPTGFTPLNHGAEWNPHIDLAEGGSYTFKVEVDINKVITEVSEGNNTKTLSKTFVAGTPDLTVTDVDAQITRVASNGTVYTKVMWKVTNSGDGKAAGSFVTVLKVSKNSGSFVELSRYTRSNLLAGASSSFTSTPNFTNVNKLKFRIETDATNVVQERSNANNTADSGMLQP